MDVGNPYEHRAIQRERDQIADAKRASALNIIRDVANQIGDGGNLVAYGCNLGSNEQSLLRLWASQLRRAVQDLG